MTATTRQEAVRSIASDAFLDLREDISGLEGQSLSDSFGRYVFSDDVRIYFLMDFVEGGELFRHLVKVRRFSHH